MDHERGGGYGQRNGGAQGGSVQSTAQGDDHAAPTDALPAHTANSTKTSGSLAPRGNGRAGDDTPSTSDVFADETRLRDFAEVSSDWFWEMDREFRFTYASKGLNTESDGDKVGIIGKTPWECAKVDPNETPEWRQHVQDLKAQKTFRDFHSSVTDAGGNTFYWRVSGKPCFDTNGKFMGYRGTGANEKIGRAHV